ncbi:MAG: nickel-dependent lactate racemase family protein, partial [Anaerolineales bacterium]
PGEPLEDVPAAIHEALIHPIGNKPLMTLARRGTHVCIVFTDITRSCPDHLLVPAILAELQKAGVKDEDITLLCATGMHRASTLTEKISKLGADIVNRIKVIDNEPQNPHVLENLGVIGDNVTVKMHRAVVDADLVIATGIVEPHQYAGYSGGNKTVAIGAAGESFIAYTHGPDFIDHPHTRLGRIDGNPFQEAVTEVARRAKVSFIVNIVQDDEKRVLCVQAGEPNLAFQELVSFAKSIYEVPIRQQYDIAVCGVGYPKDTNLYQASRAASYLFFAPIPVVRKGGVMIIPARCEEGAGSGVGEQRFLAAMRDAPNVQFILEDARRNGYPPGQQRAFVMAKVLEHVSVVIVGSEFPDLVADCKMIPATTMNEAFTIAEKKVGKSSDVVVVPHSLLTLPIINL